MFPGESLKKEHCTGVFRWTCGGHGRFGLALDAGVVKVRCNDGRKVKMEVNEDGMSVQRDRSLRADVARRLLIGTHSGEAVW